MLTQWIPAFAGMTDCDETQCPTQARVVPPGTPSDRFFKSAYENIKTSVPSIIKLPSMNKVFGKYKVVLICVFLAGATLAVYWQVLSSDFVNFDDTIYVTENEHVKRGFSWDSIKWAFAAGTVAYWHPLTWLSHMLDCELYGLRPGLHHLTSLVIHIANSLLLFLVLRRMTGAVWKGAFVAALFALHPINVDSVAWIAERKNVLSTLFWLLTMLAYASYAHRGGIARYLAALCLFALGLLAKPMLVTLPFVMLLLDYWPLKRFQREESWGLVREKIPFLALSGISVYLSYLSVRRLGITLSTDLVPIKLRVTQAVVSYMAYIRKIIMPRKLAVFYPYPQEVVVYETLGAALFLVCVSVVLVWVLRNRPYLGIGWLWFIGTLVPVIGFVQAGLWPAMADRWAYIPLIGIGIITAWGVGDIVAGWRLRTSTVGLAAGICLSALAVCTWLQAGYWHNSYTLFTHALQVTTDNYIAHLNLGNVYLKKKDVHQAMSHYNKAIAVHRNFAEAHYNLGIALGLQEEYDKAISQYRTALRLKKDHWKARFHLANALAKSGQLDEAIIHYERVVELRPGDPEVLNNFALALAKKGRIDEAIEYYNRCLQIEPDSVEVLNNLANALVEQEQVEQAVAHLEKALSLKPDFAQTHYNLANILSEAGRLDEATMYYRSAIQLDPNELDAYLGLGLVLVRQRQHDEAMAYFEKAIQLDPNFAQAHYNLGKIFADRNETGKAIAQFREVLRIVPNDAAMHCNLGILLARQGRLNEAIKEFRTAVELDPKLSRARQQLEAALARKSAPNPP